MLLLSAALLLLAPAASADASGVSIPAPNSLWIVEADPDRENTIVLTYDAQTREFRITDEGGVAAGVGCIPVIGGVACADPTGAIREIHVALKGGDDLFSVGDESDPMPPQLLETIIGAGAGNDVVIGGNSRNRILGEDGRDVLAGGDAADRLVGGDGRDGLIGFGEDDLIWGGDGADAIFAFGGDDILRGQTGSDTLIAGRGDDRLLGGRKADLLFGGKGIDHMLGGAGHDRLLAKDGRRDRRIDCGPGRRERKRLQIDAVDPKPIRC